MRHKEKIFVAGHVVKLKKMSENWTQTVFEVIWGHTTVKGRKVFFMAFYEKNYTHYYLWEVSEKSQMCDYHLYGPSKRRIHSAVEMWERTRTQQNLPSFSLTTV